MELRERVEAGLQVAVESREAGMEPGAAGFAGESRSDFEEDVASGQRFEFGKNWQRFLSVLDEERVAEAQRSLTEMLGMSTLTGKTFLDVGSGSGLFSLAAMRLGAEQVHSFDYDPQSVACTQELKRRYFADAARWKIEQGSVLDEQYLRDLGQFDVVYSWGVLHHTGEMWRALANVADLVKPGGVVFISIYNDQGGTSRRWKTVKRIYNSGTPGRLLTSGVFIPYFILRGAAGDLIRHTNPLRGYREYKRSRGMSRVHDWFDWLGGYPFEVAKPEDVFAPYHDQGFRLERLKTCGGGLGCNEFVLRKQ
jgi:2-polyprenyl-3-methyl-5-hydroxy-6-metoxy-1,4-benzoquinol methylase